MKKLLIAVFCVVMLMGAGIALWLNLPNDQGQTLEFEVAESVRVVLGDEVELVYSVNIEDAVLSFKSDDSSVASVIIKGDGVYNIKGNSIGETKIVAMARYGQQKVAKEVEVLVTNTQMPPAEDGNGPNGDDDDEELDFSIVVASGGELDGNVIKLNQMTAYFSINTETEVIPVFETGEGLSIVTTELSDKTFKLQVVSAGEYSFTIKLQNKTKEFVVVFK